MDEQELRYNQLWAKKNSKSGKFESIWDSPLLDSNKEELQRGRVNVVRGFEIQESKVYKCAKCGSRKIAFDQIQDRAADEQGSTRFTCHGCGNTWKK